MKNNSKIKINELNSKLDEAIIKYNSYKKDSLNEIDKIKKENSEKLKILSEEKQKEIFDLKKMGLRKRRVMF